MQSSTSDHLSDGPADAVGGEQLAGASGDSAGAMADLPGERARYSNSWPYPVAVALSTLLLGLASGTDPLAGVIGGVGAGVLCLLRRRVLAWLVIAAMLLALLAPWSSGATLGYWALIALLFMGSIAPVRLTSSLLRVAPMVWAACLILCAVSICGLLMGTQALAGFFIIVGSVCSALLGAGLTRHLAMVDARIMAWGDAGLSAVTRDLLLGRVTRGMLHDLSQPLNVISMANGNLGYIVEHLEIDQQQRQQLLDRLGRISAHTDNAASILSLFRWFGRNPEQAEAGLSVRNALNRAIASTHSNARYNGVKVELEGNALDLPVTRQHGRLELMAVAALLSALGAYGLAEGKRAKGQIVVFATASATHISIGVRCSDENEKPVDCTPIDNATLWLLEQVALEAEGDFRSHLSKGALVPFTITLKREDI